MKVSDIRIPRIKQLALINMITIGSCELPPANTKEQLLDTPLSQAFDWDDSIQGHDFWEAVEKHDYLGAKLEWDWGTGDSIDLSVSTPPTDTYALVEWPESQEYMDEPWFEEEAHLTDGSAYFIPTKYIK